jgi:hypothetical protein
MKEQKDKRRSKRIKKEAEESPSPLTISLIRFYLDQNLFLYEINRTTPYIKIMVKNNSKK